MKTRKHNYGKLGLFVLIGSVIFVVAIFYIGRQQKLFGDNFRLITHYRSIEGLTVGNNVRFSGINVGIVDDITIINDTTVRVTLLIEDDVRKFIKMDAKADISSNGLMGDRIINIVPGTANAPEVKDGSVIASLKPFSISEIIEPLKATAQNASEISTDLAIVSKNIRDGKGVIGRLFTDEEMAQNMSSTMENVNSASSKIDEGVGALKDNWLFRGYFKRKEREKQKQEEEKLKKQNGTDEKKLTRKERRELRRKQREERKKQKEAEKQQDEDKK